jgi:hypothetical protein
MFSGNARSPQTEQADQKPERFYDKRRQIELENQRYDYQQRSRRVQK